VIVEVTNEEDTIGVIKAVTQYSGLLASGTLLRHCYSKGESNLEGTESERMDVFSSIVFSSVQLCLIIP